MPGRRHCFSRLPLAAVARCQGGALLETIIAMMTVAVFLSGLHLTNSQVMSQVRASLESVAALRDLGGLVENIDVLAHLASPGTIDPIVVTRQADGTASVMNAGGSAMAAQPSVRVDLTASWTGKGGRSLTRQVSLIVAQGGLIGRN